MKTIAMFLVLMFGVQSGSRITPQKVPPIPDAEYSVGCTDDRGGIITVEVWVQSHSEHGISCAFVDITSNLSVVGIAHGDDFTVFNSGTIDNFGIVNLGGCSFAGGGTGLAPEWALVAEVDFATAKGVPLRVFLEEPSHPILTTSIFGEGNAGTIGYGKTVVCRAGRLSR